MECIAAVVVSQTQLGNAGGEGSDAAAREFIHDGQQGRLVHGLFHRDLEVGTHGGVNGFLIDQRARVALNGRKGDDGKGEQHNDGQTVHRFGRT